MDTIFGLKRRREEEPSDALLVTCKRKKQCDEEVNAVPVTAIIKLTATVAQKDDNVKEHVPEKLRKEDLKANYKKYMIDVRNKLRKTCKERRTENRLKVVNSKRDLVKENLKIIDIEDAKLSKMDKILLDNTDPLLYVYDLYFTNPDEELPLDNLISVETVNDEFVFDDDYEDYGVDSDDSNAESNLRNDYPDSENSDGEEENIRNAMKRRILDDHYSSDEDFVYGLDKGDVRRYGQKFAKCKTHYDSDSQEDESDDNEDYD